MICRSCGTTLGFGTTFCPVCGEACSEGAADGGRRGFSPAVCAAELEVVLPPLRVLEDNYRKINLYSQESQRAGQDTRLLAIGGCALVGYLLSLLTEAVFGPGLGVYLVWFGSALLLYGLFAARRVAQAGERERDGIEETIQAYRTANQDQYELVHPILEKYLPDDYWYSSAIEAISSYLRNRRADSIKEAINLYEEEMHRLRLENTAQLILIENRKQTAYAAMQLFATVAIGFQISSMRDRVR